MKERPILFSGPMVRALLGGTKTQTRRVVKPQPDSTHSGFPYWNIGGYRAAWCRSAEDGGPLVPANPLPCPYGQPGDRLWVRETWFPDPPNDGSWPYTSWAGCREGQIAAVPERFRRPAFCCYGASWPHGGMRWTPSIHMPRWASRIALEVTGVRVERLLDISDADALAEGIERQGSGWRCYTSVNAGLCYRSPVNSYLSLWNAINGDGSSEANPLVWAIEFKRISPA